MGRSAVGSVESHHPYMSDDNISSNSNARELRNRITAVRQALHVAISPCVKERLGGREAARQLGLDKTLG